VSRRFYITTAIPYVNGDPHLGHALEFVQADVLARHRRLREDDVRFLSGTDDNALKNVAAADAEGVPIAEFVRRNAARFAALREPLQLSYDDFIRTSVDPRHRAGVERLWRACAAAGDLYERDYDGLYCTGCEAFLSEDELVDGRCPEHDEAPEHVRERNWFFRLSRYQTAVLELLESDRLSVRPEHRRAEVSAFVRAGLNDFSVSRSRARARNWGIPVPDDPAQVIYVWFDALANYVTALDYGNAGDAYRDWWSGADERVHAIGKGILRFHAVYWPAILLSAGEPPPTTILVHEYLTVNGAKISKSTGFGVEPATLVSRYGADAVRWWLLRDVPRAADADFREELLAARANELADDLGNLVNRTIALVRRYRPDGVAHCEEAPGRPRALVATLDGLADTVDEALGKFDFRAATEAIWRVVGEANRYVSTTRPWELGNAERRGDRTAAAALDEVLSLLLAASWTIAKEVGPFLPAAAGRIESALERQDTAAGRVLFRKPS
jgi:methionyl-tRNA synthetase